MANRAINNFSSAEIQDGKLIVHGKTLEEGAIAGAESMKFDLGPGAVIEVTLISKSKPADHCQPVVDNPSSTPWSCVSERGEHPFRGGEEVFAVGFAESDSQPPTRWVDQITIAADPKA